VERRWVPDAGEYLRMQASLKVAVAAAHCGNDEVVVLDCFGDRFGQWAAIPYTRCTTKTDEMGAQRFQVW